MHTIFRLAFLVIDQHTAEIRAEEAHRLGEHSWATQFEHVASLSEAIAQDDDRIRSLGRGIPSYLG